MLRLLSVRGAVASVLAPCLCWGCGGPARRAEPLCLACRRTLRFLGREPVVIAGVPTWAAVSYEGAARELVRGLKFAGATAIADTMAALIAANAPDGLLRPPPAPDGRESERVPVLVPVPLHPRRLRRRGYNQAAVLANAVASRTGLAVVDCLVRSGDASSQVGRPRAARLAAPPGAIDEREGVPVPTYPILVDDVATTGATLASCAAAVRAAGARRTAAIAFARTPGR